VRNFPQSTVIVETITQAQIHQKKKRVSLLLCNTVINEYCIQQQTHLHYNALPYIVRQDKSMMQALHIKNMELYCLEVRQWASKQNNSASGFSADFSISLSFSHL
jgi:hypothetical protein